MSAVLAPMRIYCWYINSLQLTIYGRTFEACTACTVWATDAADSLKYISYLQPDKCCLIQEHLHIVQPPQRHRTMARTDNSKIDVEIARNLHSAAAAHSAPMTKTKFHQIQLHFIITSFLVFAWIYSCKKKRCAFVSSTSWQEKKVRTSNSTSQKPVINLCEFRFGFPLKNASDLWLKWRNFDGIRHCASIKPLQLNIPFDMKERCDIKLEHLFIEICVPLVYSFIKMVSLHTEFRRLLIETSVWLWIRTTGSWKPYKLVLKSACQSIAGAWTVVGATWLISVGSSQYTPWYAQLRSKANQCVFDIWPYTT